MRSITQLLPFEGLLPAGTAGRLRSRFSIPVERAQVATAADTGIVRKTESSEREKAKQDYLTGHRVSGIVRLVSSGLCAPVVLSDCLWVLSFGDKVETT